MLADVGDAGEAIWRSFGSVLAEIDAALQSFAHPAMHRELHWDVKLADRALEHVRLLSPERRTLVEHFMAEWRVIDWQTLRHGVIHNDANDYNVLVESGRVVGFLDFGDMVHSAVVCDPAIAIAYAMLGKTDPIAVASSIITAYHAHFRLTPAEVGAVFPLATARLCISVCTAAYNARAKSDDPYQQISAAPAWDLLGRLVKVPMREIQERIRSACTATTDEQLLVKRRKLLGGSVRLSYTKPAHIVRGEMQYLYDADGRQYLDAYNNVPHVGHCHPRVVDAAAAQMRTLNTNTRYLNELVTSYAERLISTLPAPLRVCFFVNSGSEANELALRLARTHTARREVVVLEQAYHGNTTTLIDISPYKHNAKGGQGAPEWVHAARLPDVYRGRHKRSDPDAGSKYADSVVTILDRLKDSAGPAAFIAESWPSVGGQLQLPQGYLPAVYEHVRAAGGVCIADEVQTGFGRLGKWFWGFETYGVVPDIVVMGKPMGNGHPIGAVVTTPEIAASFDNGLEFFSTFGGNTVSCAAGLAVLDVIRDEDLQRHAAMSGDRLLAGLSRLKEKHALIGDVRGSGLFLGVEFVRNRDTLEPATGETASIVNALRDRAILTGTEGEFNNVLKIRPPMPFTAKDGDVLLQNLDEILNSP
jgi:4-aminobutyrate aminotransferase-like enzyme